METIETKWDSCMKDCVQNNPNIKKMFFTSDSLDILYFPTSLSYAFQIIDKNYINNLNSARIENMKNIMVFKQFKSEALEKLPENFFEMVQSEEIAFAFYKDKRIHFVHKEAAKQLLEQYKIKHICSTPLKKTDLILLYQTMHYNNKNFCCSVYNDGAVKIISSIEEVAPNAMKNVGLLIANFKNSLPKEHEFVSYEKDEESGIVKIYIELPEYTRQSFICGLEYVFSLGGEEISLTMLMSNKNVNYEDRYYIKLLKFKNLEKFSMQQLIDTFNSIGPFDKESLLSLDKNRVLKALDIEDIFGKQRARDMIIPEFSSKYDFIKFMMKIPFMFDNIELPLAKKNKLDKRISSVFKNPYIVF